MSGIAWQHTVSRKINTSYLPLGCDFRTNRPDGFERRNQLLFVGDLIEPRKRFDRVLPVFRLLREEDPGLRLVVVGNASDAVREQIPEELGEAVDLLGYIDGAGAKAGVRRESWVCSAF